MKEELSEFYDIFTGTKKDIESFMAMLDPVINNAKDDHERLYYHHIFEEEEQRLARLAELIPLIETFQAGRGGDFTPSNNTFNRLLQELNLEKFGLHNFVEHLDLALFQFKDAERQAKLSQMRESNYKSYQFVKEKLAGINKRFDTGYTDPHAHHDEHGDHLNHHAHSDHHSHVHTSAALLAKPAGPKRTFTVGSLISK
ncbi:hypothetical protein RG959_06830 [Domibacillus sp. 8LH]|uniref:IMEF encapsulin system ferritin-like cargo protein n=1 Tax=Domibacillus sp. 8LH TaxID=3073900 RepID=UPI00317EEFD5